MASESYNEKEARKMREKRLSETPEEGDLRRRKARDAKRQLRFCQKRHESPEMEAERKNKAKLYQQERRKKAQENESEEEAKDRKKKAADYQRARRAKLRQGEQKKISNIQIENDNTISTTISENPQCSSTMENRIESEELIVSPSLPNVAEDSDDEDIEVSPPIATDRHKYKKPCVIEESEEEEEDIRSILTPVEEIPNSEAPINQKQPKPKECITGDYLFENDEVFNDLSSQPLSGHTGRSIIAEELPVKCKKSNVIEEPKEEQIEFRVPPPTMSPKKTKPKESVAAGYDFEESDVFNNIASQFLDRNIDNKKSQSRDVSSTTSKEFNSPPSPDFFDESTLYQKRKSGLSLKKRQTK